MFNEGETGKYWRAGFRSKLREGHPGESRGPGQWTWTAACFALFLPVQCPLLLTAFIPFRVSALLPWIQLWWNCHQDAPPSPGQRSAASQTPSPRTLGLKQHHLLLKAFPPPGQMPFFCASRVLAIRALTFVHPHSSLVQCVAHGAP